MTLRNVRQAHRRLIVAREAERAASLELREAILAARANSHSLAVIGRELGLSRQRVLQLSK